MAHAQVITTQSDHSSFSRRLSGALKGAWEQYWVRRAERATVLVLHSLDDRTLQDIGMDRSEIESVVYTARRERSGPRGRRMLASW